jgi:hypothetical protein
MATREEIITGLEFTIAQARRTTSVFAPDEWDARRHTGWTPKEIYAHLAAVASMVPAFSQGMMASPEDRDMTAGMDINQMNEQSVNTMRAMAPEQILQAFEANYAKLIEFVKALPEEQLNVKRSFGPVPMPVSDVLANIVVLHGIHHVYEANNRLGI